jgi:WhiB family transcriptional regulator, redox-sensing transcriptional regulator
MPVIVTGPDHAPWMTEAACRDEDPELFFPVSAKGASTEQIRDATAICRQCGVQAECLRYALVNHVRHGIWGGRTEQERLIMTRVRRGHRLRSPGQRR